jgi:DNA-binding NarL/FixJ family response regulator
MGVESIRARTARQAEQVIRNSPIHIAVVDLGLPLDVPGDHAAAEEAGCRVLDLLRRLPSPPPTVIVRSTRASRDAARDLSAALRFDAFAVVDRTSADVEMMLKVLQRCLERFYHGRWPASTPPPGGRG